MAPGVCAGGHVLAGIGLHVVLVLVEQANRLRQRVAAEGVAEFAGAHDLDDRRLALVHLCGDRALQCGTDLLELVHDDALGAHRLRDPGEGLALELTGDEAAVVEVDLILLLRTPLPVVEDDGGDRDVVPDSRHDLAQAHAPGAVTCVGDGIEKRVIEALDCPVMHDDQHGTAIVVLAALKGAVKVQDRDLHQLRVVISGAGAAGVACANILLAAGIADVTVLDSKGIVSADRKDLNEVKVDLAARTNPAGRRGGTAEALDGADVFLGVSAGTVPEELIATMAKDSIVFALSNPDPEIHPDIARKHAAIVATGRSDFPNQINNVLAFPGVFRGALDAGARRITEGMKLAAAEAILSVVGDELAVDKIVPSPLDPRVAPAVAEAVAAAARAEGVTD